MRTLVITTIFIPFFIHQGLPKARAHPINCESPVWRIQKACQNNGKTVLTSAPLKSAEQTVPHKAWCGRPKNKCKVYFDGHKMRVDNGIGINRNQLISYESNTESYKLTSLWTHIFKYNRKDGSTGFAKVIFNDYVGNQNFKASADRFWERR